MLQPACDAVRDDSQEVAAVSAADTMDVSKALSMTMRIVDDTKQSIDRWIGEGT